MIVFAAVLLIQPASSEAFPVSEIKINMDAIRLIESAGCDTAVNPKSGATGAYQITKICLEDYNRKHKVRYSIDDLKKYEINHRVASWYLNTRIPELLKAFSITISIETILVAYNAGITYCKNSMRALPPETVKYIEKYKTLENINHNFNMGVKP